MPGNTYAPENITISHLPSDNCEASLIIVTPLPMKHMNCGEITQQVNVKGKIQRPTCLTPNYGVFQ